MKQELIDDGYVCEALHRVKIEGCYDCLKADQDEMRLYYIAQREELRTKLTNEIEQLKQVSDQQSITVDGLTLSDTEIRMLLALVKEKEAKITDQVAEIETLNITVSTADSAIETIKGWLFEQAQTVWNKKAEIERLMHPWVSVDTPPKKSSIYLVILEDEETPPMTMWFDLDDGWDYFDAEDEKPKLWMPTPHSTEVSEEEAQKNISDASEGTM